MEEEAVVVEDPLYRSALTELRSPKPLQSSALWFFILFILFIVGNLGELKSFSGIVVLIAVLLFHEAGHALGMRVFGFKDVRMFFIPFFGAAVSGRPRGVAAWKEAVVSLLGPLPGIIAAVAGLIALGRRPEPLLVTTVEVLLYLNLFNLLPFGALDGGRLLQRILFSRHRVLEVAFLAIGSLLLAWLAVTGSMVMLLIFALFGLVALPARWRILGFSARLRAQHPDLASDPESLDDAQGRALFDAAREFSRSDDSTRIAQAMESMLEAAKRPPRFLSTLGLLALYGLALILGVFALAFLVTANGDANWNTVEQDSWSAEFPQHALSDQELEGDDLSNGRRAAVHVAERFAVRVVATSKPVETAAWMTRLRDRAAADRGLQPVADKPIKLGELEGREFELSRPGRVMRIRMFAVNDRIYEVSASAPEWGENQRRFFASFKIDQSKR